jgi:phage nucleotide-binding protein
VRVEIKNSETVGTRFPWVKALIYGSAGSGKTRFAADALNPFWFDFESSTETLRHYPEFRNIPVKKPVNVEELRKDVEKAIVDPAIDTVVIDSITTSLDYYLRQRMDRIAHSSKPRDKYELYEADYKYATQVFTDLFGFLQDAPINVVIIGHERVIRDTESGNITGIYPDITPRLQQAVTRLVNVVGYMEIRFSNQKGTSRRLYVNRTNTIEAKNRLNIQETYIEEPNWKVLFND